MGRFDSSERSKSSDLNPPKMMQFPDIKMWTYPDDCSRPLLSLSLNIHLKSFSNHFIRLLSGAKRRTIYCTELDTVNS
jgi:hypothetical protein